MHRQTVQRWLTVACGVWMACALAAHADDAPLSEAMQAVQGKWVRQAQSPQGLVTLVKQHLGHTTRLTVYDAQQNVLYAHESEFQVEQSGKVRILTFSNVKVTAGPNAGQSVPKSESYIYRIDGKRFLEVHGLLEGDTSAPSLIVWERPADQGAG